MEQGKEVDPTIHSFQNTVLPHSTWFPLLDTIIERQINQQLNDKKDIQIDNIGISRPSRKTQQGQMRKLCSKYDILSSTSATGLYKHCLRMQNNGGANRSITDQ
jgi:hypothetical protein